LFSRNKTIENFSRRLVVIKSHIDPGQFQGQIFVARSFGYSRFQNSPGLSQAAKLIKLATDDPAIIGIGRRWQNP